MAEKIVNGTKAKTELMAPEEFDRALSDIAGRWKTHQDQDLGIRHETGVLLNRRLGAPGKRQSRGKEVIKQVAQQLGIDQSDVSRLRSFAHHFESIDDLKRHHPDADSWRKVKVLLPSLTGSKRETSTESPSSARKLMQALETLTLKLKKGVATPSQDEKTELLGKLRELAQAVADCLHESVSIAVEETSSAEAPEELAPVA